MHTHSTIGSRKFYDKTSANSFYILQIKTYAALTNSSDFLIGNGAIVKVFRKGAWEMPFLILRGYAFV